MSRTVEVTELHPAMGSVWSGLGIDVETGETVWFAGDARAMALIHDALLAGEDDVRADLPDWAVRSVTPS